MHRPYRVASSRRSQVFATVVTVGVTVLGVVPSSAVTKSTDTRVVLGSTPKTGSDRIAMPRRVLAPTVAARRALGSVYKDRVSAAFTVTLGGSPIGKIGGLVELSTGDADLQYRAISETGETDEVPYRVRIRNGRVQVSLPTDLRDQVGVDGYVTSIQEGASGQVGLSDEVLLSIALLTSLPLPNGVSSWTEKTPRKSSTATRPVSRDLRGTSTRSDFTVLAEERFGSTAAVALQLQSNGTLGNMAIRFTPLKTAAKGGGPVELKGTVKSSTRSLADIAPTGTYVTASKFFDLDPLPETKPASSISTGD